MVDITHESKASKAQFFGNTYDGTVVFDYDGCQQTMQLKCSEESQASLVIYTGGNMYDGIFHFGILFENYSFEAWVNGAVVCPKGSRPFLFMENNCVGQGVTFFLTDEQGKNQRLKGNKSGFLGEASQLSTPVPCYASFDTIMQICQ